MHSLDENAVFEAVFHPARFAQNRRFSGAFEPELTLRLQIHSHIVFNLVRCPPKFSSTAEIRRIDRAPSRPRNHPRDQFLVSRARRVLQVVRSVAAELLKRLRTVQTEVFERF